MESKQYDIGGRRFYQQPLTLGQAEHLTRELVGLQFRTDSTLNLVMDLWPAMPRILACVLIPEGEGPGFVVKQWDTHAEELSETITFLRNELPLSLAVEIATHFFELSQISSLPDQLVSLAALMPAFPPMNGTPGKNSTLISPAAITPSGQPSASP